jgi:HPt (histidine-containing phosphotransfer) domain-containing protein
MEKGSTMNLHESVAPGLEPFVADFFKDRKKDQQSLRTFVDDMDYDSARKIAHNWKGFCEPYGFAGLGLLAAELEQALKNEDDAAIQNLLLNIDAYFLKKVIPKYEN